jgi:hypothetical protein
MAKIQFDVSPEELGIDADADAMVRVSIDTTERIAFFAVYEPNSPEPWGRNPNNMIQEDMDFDEALELWEKLNE